VPAHIRLTDLLSLSEQIAERDLGHVRRLAEARATTRTRLQRLTLKAAPCDDAHILKVQQAHLLWAGQQRIALNMQLARDEAAFLDARLRAARSHGRAQVLRELVAQSGKSFGLE
jgi:hypothetical protein